MTTETTQSVVTKRKVTIVPTRGKQTTIEFEGKLWKELEPALKSAGITTEGMKCVEGVNNTTLEHPEAKVPEGNFPLFLMPYRSKSGAAPKKAAKKVAPKKAAKKAAPKKAVAKKAAPKKAAKAKAKTNVADVVDSVATSKVEVPEPTEQELANRLSELSRGFKDVVR